MRTIKYFSSFICLFAILLTLNSCGRSGPTTPVATSTSVSTTPTNPPLTINAYQGSGHKDIITVSAINLLLSSPDLTAKQKTLLLAYRANIEAGSMNEDDPIWRTANHFWDPIHDIPLTDDGIAQSVVSGQKAIQWAKNGDLFMYDFAESDFKNNIGFYNPYDSSTRLPGLGAAMTDLGHTVHMFQDMTSVPHTRNDNHMPFGFYGGASGYESYVVTGSYSPPQVNTYITITDYKDMWKKFEDLALFTNGHFYSEDTIPVPGQAPWRTFHLPILPAGTGYLGNGIIPILVFADKNDITRQIDYSLDDVVHQSNADILVPRAISYTAGVIKYFLSLKGDGTITIDSPADGTVVYVPSVGITGSLTYYASSATIYYRAVSSPSLSRTKIEVPVALVNGKYTFAATVPLELGANTIDAEAYNENVNYASTRITVIYKKKTDPTPPPAPPAPPSLHLPLRPLRVAGLVMVETRRHRICLITIPVYRNA